MVYTITFNPALDYVMHVKDLEDDDINRTFKEELFFGGKGINVSVILSRLGIENTALGYIAGFTGDKLQQMLEEEKINCDFIKLKSGNTRINVKIKAQREIDINARGPEISDADADKLQQKLEEVKEGDFLVMSGSIPKTLPNDIYEKIMQRYSESGINFVVDSEKAMVMRTLKYHPFLVKPNHHELGNMFDVKIKTLDDVKKYAAELQALGAKNVLVSMASHGAFLLDENGKTYISENAPGKLVNSVGCGDSMVAGFIAGYLKSKDYGEALKLGSAAGNATAFSLNLGTREEIEEVYKALK